LKWALSPFPSSSSRTANPENTEAIIARGNALWNSIYEPDAVKLHDKLASYNSYHPDLICMFPLPSPFLVLGPMWKVDGGLHYTFPFDRDLRVVASASPIVLSSSSSLLFAPAAAHGDAHFLAFIIQSYGSVLSPLPGADEQGNLSRALGSVVGIACLRTEGRVGPQLTSHVFGLLKARMAQDLSEEDRWLASDEGTEWVIRTIDTLLDVVIAERGDGDPQEA